MDEVIEIVDLLIRRVREQLEGQGIGLELTPDGEGVRREEGVRARRSAPVRCAGRSSS